jgi:outer membrane protein OmpA-like peptidoglycan-associated protein
VVGGYETLTAIVTTGATGTIDFTADGTSISGCASVAIVSDSATCVTNSLSAGARGIRANYSGNTTYASSVSASTSVTVLDKFTVSYDNRGGTQATTSEEFIVGSAALVLPAPTRMSYEFNGWFDAATNGSQIGIAGDSYTPTSTGTLYARWVQTSLFGMGASTKIGTITTVAGVGNGFSASRSATRVQVDYVADALPDGTVIDVYLLSDTTRAQAFITDSSSLVVNLVLAWKALDDTVPDTANGKPIVMTITNSSIKRGAKIYALLGSSLIDLGTATQDGQAMAEITRDPEIFVVSTKPDTATAVTGVAGDTQVTVSWSAPASNGGAEITNYTVTSSAGQSCTTATLTCVVIGLTNGIPYTFSVVATNSIGNSSSSSASASVTPGAAVTPPSGGGSTPAVVTPPVVAPVVVAPPVVAPVVVAPPVVAPPVVAPPQAMNQTPPAVVVKRPAKTKIIKVFFPLGEERITNSQLRALNRELARIPKKKIMEIRIKGFVQKTLTQVNDNALPLLRAKAVAGQIKKLGIRVKPVLSSGGYAPEKSDRARRAEITIKISQ